MIQLYAIVKYDFNIALKVWGFQIVEKYWEGRETDFEKVLYVALTNEPMKQKLLKNYLLFVFPVDQTYLPP